MRFVAKLAKIFYTGQEKSIERPTGSWILETRILEPLIAGYGYCMRALYIFSPILTSAFCRDSIDG